MSRPREFDEDEVLFQALLLFWRNGYEGCSIVDLLEATGLKRQSLYNTFGDKHGLFMAVLDRYEQRVRADLAPLRAKGAGLHAVAEYMEKALVAQQRLGSGACMLVVTAFSTGSDDPQTQAIVNRGAQAVRSAFADLLRRAQRCGDVAADVEPKAAASFLFSVLNGLSALRRTGGKISHTSRVITRAIRSLQP